MELERAGAFLAEHNQGVLITIRGNGRAQSSNIAYHWDDDPTGDSPGGVARISLTADRAKTRNAQRDQRVSLHVSSKDFWQYVVIEGIAEFTPVTTSPGDEAGRMLAEVFEKISGSAHPDWDEFHQAMIDEQRLVMTVRPERAYGQLMG